MVYNLNRLTNDYLTLVTWQTRVENVPAKEIAIHAVIKNSNHFRAWSTKITKGILRGVRYERRCKRVWQNLDSTLHWRRYRASDVKRGASKKQESASLLLPGRVWEISDAIPRCRAPLIRKTMQRIKSRHPFVVCTAVSATSCLRYVASLSWRSISTHLVWLWNLNLGGSARRF